MHEVQKRIADDARRAIESNYLILDTETTGLYEDAQIVEIAIIDAEGMLEFSAIVKPSKPIPSDAAAIHGITDDVVERAPTWLEVWPMVKSIAGARPLLAYNTDFDARMVSQTNAIYKIDEPFDWWRCLMNDWMQFHGLRRWQRLENVCYEIGVPVGGHRALGDAKAAREVLRWLAKQEVSINV